jgi:hypothetical protein
LFVAGLALPVTREQMLLKREVRILFTMTVGFVVVALWTVIAWMRYFLASVDRSAGRRELALNVSKLLGILAVVLVVLYALYWVQRGK